jgi:hypothetical protein
LEPGEPTALHHRVRARRFEILVAAQILFLLLHPWFEEDRFGLGLASLLPTAMILAAVYAVAETRRSLWFATALAVVALWGTWWEAESHAALPRVAGLVAETGLFVFGTVTIASEVFSGRSVGRDTLFGGIAIYGLLGFIWAGLYLILEALAPGSFAIAEARADTALWANLLYFSFTALTTTGFGDVAPASALASSLVILEYMAGVIYMAVIVARLVGLYTTRG